MSGPNIRRRSIAALVGLGIVATGCTTTHRASAATATAAPTTQAPVACSAAARTQASRVARRILGNATASATLAAAKVEHSAALRRAVARDDPVAARAALAALHGHFERIVVRRGSRTLAAYGTRPSLGTARGVIRSAAGSRLGTFALAASADTGTAALIGQLTGTQLTMSRHGQVVAGNEQDPLGADATLTTAAFPSGPLQVVMHSSTPCMPANWTAADGAVAQRVFQHEQSSRLTLHMLHRIGNDPRFAQAVASRKPAALRAQIVRIFQSHLHVVRVRATDTTGQLIGDVGGPYVLAPVTGPVIANGVRVGTVTLSIQDDQGFIKLVQHFTGADVIASSTSGRVPYSTLPINPARLPASGPLTYNGRHYEIVSFTVEAFPSGPLHVWVLTSRRSAFRSRSGL